MSSKCNLLRIIDHVLIRVIVCRYPPELVRQHKEAMRDSLYAGNKILAKGGSALDAVVEAVRMMEGKLDALQIN